MEDLARQHDSPPARPYEVARGEELDWDLKEASRHFEGGGPVYEALRRIAARLDVIM